MSTYLDHSEEREFKNSSQSQKALKKHPGLARTVTEPKGSKGKNKFSPRGCLIARSGGIQ